MAPMLGTGAPGMLGPTPPDAAQMTLEDHCRAILQILQTQPVTPDMMNTLTMFEDGKEAVIQMKLQEAGAGQQPGGPPTAEQMAGESEDYGTGFGGSDLDTQEVQG